MRPQFFGGILPAISATAAASTSTTVLLGPCLVGSQLGFALRFGLLGQRRTRLLQLLSGRFVVLLCLGVFRVLFDRLVHLSQQRLPVLIRLIDFRLGLQQLGIVVLGGLLHVGDGNSDFAAVSRQLIKLLVAQLGPAVG